jgi:hypothetical protein
MLQLQEVEDGTPAATTCAAEFLLRAEILLSRIKAENY